MQTLISTARNIRHLIHDGKIVSEIEAVLTVCSKETQFVGPNTVNTETLETIRFRLAPESAIDFANRLDEWAIDAHTEAARLTVDPDPDVAVTEE